MALSVKMPSRRNHWLSGIEPVDVAMTVEDASRTLTLPDVLIRMRARRVEPITIVPMTMFAAGFAVKYR